MDMPFGDHGRLVNGAAQQVELKVEDSVFKFGRKYHVRFEALLTLKESAASFLHCLHRRIEFVECNAIPKNKNMVQLTKPDTTTPCLTKIAKS